MKGKLLGLIAVTALALGVAATGAQAQSAKFAASWDNDPVTARAAVDVSHSDSSSCIYGTWNATDGTCEDFAAETEMADIHISTHKSVLIGVSAQIGIHLITNAKGKGGATTTNVESTAKAQGDVAATVTLVNQGDGPDCTVEPGPIIFKSEMRELKVAADSTADEVEVLVSIDTNSVSANHFNFLGVECDQGWYKANVDFDLYALAKAAGIDPTYAEAYVTLGSRMVTLQEVRAVKGTLVED